MNDGKKLIRSNLQNKMVVFSVLKDAEIIISVEKKYFEKEEEFSNDSNTSEEEKKLNNEVYGKLEKIYRISLNDKDFQSRGLKYIKNKLLI